MPPTCLGPIYVPHRQLGPDRATLLLFHLCHTAPGPSPSSTHSLLACNVLFFIDKLQSIFTNGIILKILLQLLLLLLLLLVKRIVICFSMHLLLFSQRSLSEVTTLSSICTHSGQRGEQRDLAAFARCALCLDSTSHCKAAFDRDLCLLVVLLIKMHFYCFTLSLYIASLFLSPSLLRSISLFPYLPLLPSAALNIELVESLSTFAFFFAHFPGCRYIRFPISNIYIYSVFGHSFAGGIGS